MDTRPATHPSASDEPLREAPHKREYWCFISYRHADNKEPGRQWATWLHQALEMYEVPADLVGTKNQRGDVIPERIFPVFRDEEELPADASLSTPIETALQNSRFLVVLCSPRAVQSTFVADEILRFKQLGKQDRILAAILEGEPTSGTDLSRECFPKPLRHPLDETGRLTETLAEPIAADFRLTDGTQGWTSPAAYRTALKAAGMPDKNAAEHVRSYTQKQNLMLLKIVAGVLGLPLGVLTARDQAYQIERQKQRAKLLRRWLGVVSILAVIALITSILAVQNAKEAQAQRDQVAAKSGELSDTLGIAYFHEGSARLGDTRTAREGLAYLSRAVREHGHPLAARRLLTFLQQREVWIYEDAGAAPPTDAPVTEQPARPAFVTPPSFPEKQDPGKFDRVVKGPNGLVAVSWCEDEESPDGSQHRGTGLHHFRVWDASGKPLCDWIKPDYDADHWVGNISGMTFSPDGTWIAVTVERWRQPEYLQTWDIRRGVQLGKTFEATGAHPNYQGAVFTSLSFTPLKQTEDTYRCALIIGSSRGDAFWLELMRPENPEDSYLHEVTVVKHRTAVRATHLQTAREPVLVTGSEDAEVWFTRTPGIREGAGAPALKLDHPVDTIRTDADGQIVLQSGARLFKASKIPVLNLAGAPPASSTLTAHIEEDHLVKVYRSTDEEKPMFEKNYEQKILEVRPQTSPDGMSLELEGGVFGTFLIKDGKDQFVAMAQGREVVFGSGDQQRRQPLRGLIADLRAAAEDTVIAVTRDHQYQIFNTTTGAPLSKTLDETPFFEDASAPSGTDAVLLSPDKSTLLTRSQHWEPPNAMLSWTMLWDCASGEPLSDRISYINDGLSEVTANRDLILTNDMASVEGMLAHQVKPGMHPLLAEIGESLAGLRLDAGGNLHTFAASKERLAELLQKLLQLGR